MGQDTLTQMNIELEMEKMMEYTDAADAVVELPSKWDKIAYCGKGWYWILDELDKKLTYLDPNYKIAQIKEKFGGLRFYFDTENVGVARDIMYDCQADAYYKASETCETCGKGSFRGKEYHDITVKLRGDGWYRTLCDPCDEIRKAKRERITQELI
jgi:predicted nucleic acid-binding Zn ribbon protein